MKIENETKWKMEQMPHEKSKSLDRHLAEVAEGKVASKLNLMHDKFQHKSPKNSLSSGYYAINFTFSFHLDVSRQNLDLKYHPVVFF